MLEVVRFRACGLDRPERCRACGLSRAERCYSLEGSGFRICGVNGYG